MILFIQPLLMNKNRDYTQQDLADLLNETAYEVMNKIKEKISVIDDISKI